jgi:hypothetical protein
MLVNRNRSNNEGFGAFPVELNALLEVVSTFVEVETVQFGVR